MRDPWRGRKKLKKGTSVRLSGPSKLAATVVSDEDDGFVVEYEDGNRRRIRPAQLKYMREADGDPSP